jgi:hypothetical protein
MFWVFVFPVLMTLALGVAFKGGDSTEVRVAVLKQSSSAQMAATLDADPRIAANETDAETAAKLLRDGEVALVVVPPGPQEEVAYRFDRTRPESAVARFTVDDALQRAAGRSDAFTPREELMSVPGSRYTCSSSTPRTPSPPRSGSIWSAKGSSARTSTPRSSTRC